VGFTKFKKQDFWAFELQNMMQIWHFFFNPNFVKPYVVKKHLSYSKMGA
jgi:hypothetical protein